MHRAARPPTRRAVLLGALGGLAAPALSACTGASPFSPDPAPTVPPDVLAAERAGERERRLVAAYEVALLLAPQLAERLSPLRADHLVHLGALGLPVSPAPDPTVGPSADPTAPAPPPAPVAPAPSLPPEPEALLAALTELERRAATAHGRAAVLGGRGVGAVLASLAASEAAHVVALR